jgi:type VI secretion system secreted protein VgrG
MAPTYHQATRPMTVVTPLKPDVLLLVGFSVYEAISQPFRLELDLAAEDQTQVAFDKLLGRKITVNLTAPQGQKRYFNGICISLTQGMRRSTDHTSFRMQVAPYLWLLTRRSRSRIFQNVSVPEILKTVLDIPDVSMELEATYLPRTYCVQYRETDFNFASRLMEEEGIYYYFKHSADGHQMIVSDKAAFPELQPGELIFQQTEGTHVEEERISRWQKQQHLRSYKVTLRDYHFEMPQNNLEARQEIQNDVRVGKITHKLKIGDSDNLEMYDWPGEYAHRFDAIDRAGAEQPADLQGVLVDNKRTAKIRMQQEAAESIVIEGASRYRHLAIGHTFILTERVGAPYVGSSNHDGTYVLTSIHHAGDVSESYRSGDGQASVYENSFTCVPAGLPYRPQRVTPKPVIMSTQTAVVAGPSGEEIYTDEYGRVKVQFHWDRDGQNDAYTSCWIRVGTAWAGNRWGAIHIPRVGQEVIVAFEEGDPDRPIIIGCVYNAAKMPPYLLSERKMVSGVKSNSYPGGGGYNELIMDDTKGKELIRVHGQYDMDATVENDTRELVRHNRHLIVGGQAGEAQGGDLRQDIYNDRHERIRRDQVEHVEGNLHLTVGNDQPQSGNVDVRIAGAKKELIEGDSHEHVKGARLEMVDGALSVSVGGDRAEAVGGTQHFQVRGDRNEKVDGTQSLTVGTSKEEKVGQNHALEAGMEIHLKAGMKVIIEAGVQLSLKGPGGFVDIGPAGVTIQGTMVLINSGGSAGSGSGSSPTRPKAPDAPQNASPAQPTAPDRAGIFRT